MKANYTTHEKCTHCGHIETGPSWGKLWVCFGCGRAIVRNPCVNCKGLGYVPWSRFQWIFKRLLTFHTSVKRCPICGGTGKLQSIHKQQTEK